MTAGAARGLILLCNLVLAGVVGFADYVFFFEPPNDKEFKRLKAARPGSFVPRKVVAVSDPTNWNQYRVIVEQFMKPKRVVKAPPPTKINPGPRRQEKPPPGMLATRLRVERVYFDTGNPARSACHLTVLRTRKKIHRAVGEKLDEKAPELDWTIKSIEERRAKGDSKLGYTITFVSSAKQETTLDWESSK